MIISLDPNLEGLAEKRFFSVARQILNRQKHGDPERISTIVETEANRAGLASRIKRTDRTVRRVYSGAW